MAWTTATLVEICIGLEINGYLPLILSTTQLIPGFPICRSPFGRSCVKCLNSLQSAISTPLPRQPRRSC